MGLGEIIKYKNNWNTFLISLREKAVIDLDFPQSTMNMRMLKSN